MSDSLKDQLLKAGFKEVSKTTEAGRNRPRKKPRKSTRNHIDSPAPTKQQVASEHKKLAKAKIVALIEQHAIKAFAGESVYRFMVRNRIRELHVSETIRQQLVDGAIVITRLNGKTYVVPRQTGSDILSITPEWVVIMPTDDERPDDENDHPVPDDLIW